MFQFLIGTIQTFLASVIIDISTFVSIPHRYDTNTALAMNMVVMTVFVSIPHRYDTNSATSQPSAFAIFVFQFLIGTIQTFLKDIEFNERLLAFQFLIGTIQTPKSVDISTHGKAIQHHYTYIRKFSQ